MTHDEGRAPLVDDAVERFAGVGVIFGQARIGDARSEPVAPGFPGEGARIVRERRELRLPRPGAAADAVQKKHRILAGAGAQKSAAARKTDDVDGRRHGPLFAGPAEVDFNGLDGQAALSL